MGFDFDDDDFDLDNIKDTSNEPENLDQNYDADYIRTFQEYLDEHVHGIQFKVKPPMNESAFYNRTASAFDNRKAIIDIESITDDINELYFIILDERVDLSDDKTRVEYPDWILPEDIKFFKELINIQKAKFGENEKLFKCIKYLKKAGE